MIHIFIGTKAQYIKTAPLLRKLDARGIEYRLVDSGQHACLSQRLRGELGVRSPDVFLRKGKDIAMVIHALIWGMKYVLLAFLTPGWVLRNIFGNQRGVCVIHGDTPSTLISMVLAKRAGLKVAHIEAGLRSFSYANPFPEELIRVITMRYADILFAPSSWAFGNLLKMKVRGQIINLGMNTNIESTRYALTRGSTYARPARKFIVATVHRVETILSGRKMRYVIDLLFRLSKSWSVIWVLHEPTIKQLKKFRLDLKLKECRNIQLKHLLDHADFIHLISGAEFLVTDGGSIQEESYYLNIPCLVLRKRTERQEGKGQNIYMAEFDDDRVNHFLRNFMKFKSDGSTKPRYSPSDMIIEHLLEYRDNGCEGSAKYDELVVGRVKGRKNKVSG
jgi:UDP-N-acetylglucosamine 2-epimerase